jgi:lysozyme
MSTPVRRSPKSISRKPKPIKGKRSSKKNKSTISLWIKLIFVMVTLVLLSPWYYGYVLNGFVSTWRWVRDIGEDPNYRTYRSFEIKIPKGYTLHGIDVSYYQGKIDWTKVSAMEEDDVKIDFAFIKATEGLLRIDPYFNRNWREAPKANIICGAYHFFRPQKDGEAQAKFFLQVVNMEKGDLPPVIDIETLDGVSKTKMRAELFKFLDYVEMKTGVKPIIYTGLAFYRDNLAGYVDDYSLWIAHYYQPNLNLDKQLWQFWQHSDKAKIDGIGHVVDFNVFNGDSLALENLRIR